MSFTNPPFKNNADFFDVLYQECLAQGKGFCVMLPFEADSQLGVSKSIDRMICMGLTTTKGELVMACCLHEGLERMQASWQMFVVYRWIYGCT